MGSWPRDRASSALQPLAGSCRRGRGGSDQPRVASGNAALPLPFWAAATLRTDSETSSSASSSPRSSSLSSGDMSPPRRSVSATARCRVSSSTSTEGPPSLSSRCVHSISLAKNTGHYRRLRISGGYGAIGSLLFIVGTYAYLAPGMPWWSITISETLWTWGLLILTLAVLPTDRKSVYLMSMIWVVAFLVQSYQMLYNGKRSAWVNINEFRKYVVDDSNTYEVWYIAHAICKAAMGITSGLSGLAILRNALVLYPRDCLESCWTVLWCYSVLMAVADCFRTASAWVLFQREDDQGGAPQHLMSLCWLPNEILMVLVLSTRSFRHRAQSLVSTGSRTMNMAAAISSLLGSGDERCLLRHALRLFRGVSCDVITEAILSSNASDPSLIELSRKVHFGEVDAFVSHSWHDDPTAKWEALQEWREQFKVGHGREPVVWLDKVCIDQGNIDDSLTCLPIFLSGCNELLVIAGTTYLTRLWCIVELFVFLTCGGKFENLTIRCIEGTDMRDDIMHFEASKVTCFKPDDKDRLFAFVDAAFGDWDNFAKQVQRTVQKATEPRRNLWHSDPCASFRS